MTRTAIYFRKLLNPNATEAELDRQLRQALAVSGDAVVATFADDHRLTGRGKFKDWRALVARLDDFDKVVVPSAGHIPGKTLTDLLRLLAILRSQNVLLHLQREGIDTGHCSALALLDLIAVFRHAKRSQAIRSGQARAREAGKLIGRPKIDRRVAAEIRASLLAGNGVRPTARRYGISPATVINLRRASLEIVPATCSKGT